MDSLQFNSKVSNTGELHRIRYVLNEVVDTEDLSDFENFLYGVNFFAGNERQAPEIYVLAALYSGYKKTYRINGKALGVMHHFTMYDYRTTMIGYTILVVLKTKAKEVQDAIHNLICEMLITLRDGNSTLFEACVENMHDLFTTVTDNTICVSYLYLLAGLPLERFSKALAKDLVQMKRNHNYIYKLVADGKRMK